MPPMQAGPIGTCLPFQPQLATFWPHSIQFPLSATNQCCLYCPCLPACLIQCDNFCQLVGPIKIHKINYDSIERNTLNGASLWHCPAVNDIQRTPTVALIVAPIGPTFGDKIEQAKWMCQVPDFVFVTCNSLFGHFNLQYIRKQYQPAGTIQQKLVIN